MVKHLINITFIVALISFKSFAQDYIEIKSKSIELLNKGKFQESLALLNKIKDKETLETTTINLYKTHLQNILNKRFTTKIFIQDSVYKVIIKTAFIKAQGLYDAQQKKYIIPPIYDSVRAFKNTKMDYFNVLRNDSLSLIDKNGKIMVPLSNYGRILVENNLIFIDKRTATNFSIDYPHKYITLDGKPYLDNLNLGSNGGFSSDIPNYKVTGTQNGLQIIDIETKEIIKDSLTFFTDKSYVYHNNEIASIDIEGTVKQFALLQTIKKNIVCYNVNNKLVQNTDFDTYVYSIENYQYDIKNEISDLINHKKNCTLNENQYSDDDIYLIVKKANKFGIYNLFRDKYYAEPIYDSILKNGNTFYKNKWINLVYGKKIIQAVLDYDGGIIFEENNKQGLMNLRGSIIAKAAYNEVKKSSKSDVYFLRNKEKWGFISTLKDAVVVNPKYDYIVPNNTNYKYLDAYSNKKIILYSTNGTRISEEEKNNTENLKNKEYFDFQEYNNLEISIKSRLRFKKNKLFGLDDYNYKEIVPAIYSSIDLSKNNTFIVSQKDSIYGLIDENGKEIIPLKYKSVNKDHFGSGFLLVENFENKNSVFNSKGQQLYPFIIESIINTRYENKAQFIITNEEKIIKGITGRINGEIQKFYQKSLLKLENDTLQKINVDGEYFDFYENGLIAFRKNNSLYGLYNTKTRTILPEKYKTITQNIKTKTLFATKNKFYDTIIDSLGIETPLKHYFNRIENDYYFYTENNKTGVMNPEFEVANFTYLVLKPIFYYDYYSYKTEEFKKNVNQYFKFNITTENQKMGIIKFDGTIITPPNKYDDVTICFFDEKKTNVHKEILRKYQWKLFCGSTKNKTTLFTDKSKEIITFVKKDSETWNFCQYSEAIILKSQDSIKIIDLKTKKQILKARGYHFQEREDGTFLIINYLPNSAQNIVIFDNNGNNIVNDTFDNNNINRNSFYNYYITKKETKFGIIDGYSNAKVPYIYDNIVATASNKNFIAKRKDKYGVIDTSNQVLLDFEYDAIVEKKPENNGCSTEQYSMFLEVTKNKKVGLINSENFKPIFETKFDQIKSDYYHFITKKDSVSSLNDCKGKVLYSVAVDSIKKNNYNNYQLFKKGKEVFLNKNGELISENFNNPINYEDKLKIKYCIFKDNQYYLQKNNIILYDIPITKLYQVSLNKPFDFDIDFFMAENENKKVALFDENFNEILPFNFNQIILTNSEDFIITNKNGKYGVLDFYNKQIIPFKYDKVEYNSNKQIFECKINDMFYVISPRNKLLYKGNENDSSKLKTKHPIIIPD